MKIGDLETRAAYYAVAELMRRRRRTGEPIPDAIRVLFQRLDHEIRIGTDDEPDPRIHGDEIGTDTAAAILGCTTRWIRKIAADLDGVRVGRTWVFSRAVVETYAAGRDAA
ncbi:hypothetical protein [Nocardia sp. NPDC049707]|uniref:hypothetical protein n=1 Tax=Nocardia sp. NPDC049707 TaxID=3154735 RepID=UPI00341F3629